MPWPLLAIAVKLALLRALRRYLPFPFFHSPAQFFHLPAVLLLLPPQFVYLPSVLFFQAGKVDDRRLWRSLLLSHRFCYGSHHDPLLFRRIVKTGVQVASPVLLGLLLLDLEWIGCRPRVLARARYLPTDLHPPFATGYLEAVLGKLLGNMQVWRRAAHGGELIAKISV